jgi:hypothetical protein
MIFVALTFILSTPAKEGQTQRAFRFGHPAPFGRKRPELPACLFRGEIRPKHTAKVKIHGLKGGGKLTLHIRNRDEHVPPTHCFYFVGLKLSCLILPGRQGKRQALAERPAIALNREKHG